MFWCVLQYSDQNSWFRVTPKKTGISVLKPQLYFDITLKSVLENSFNFRRGRSSDILAFDASVLC